MDHVDVEAKTVSEAIKQALGLLNASSNEVDIQILSEEKMGLFGRPGGKSAKIRASLKKKND